MFLVIDENMRLCLYIYLSNLVHSFWIKLTPPLFFINSIKICTGPTRLPTYLPSVHLESTWPKIDSIMEFDKVVEERHSITPRHGTTTPETEVTRSSVNSDITMLRARRRPGRRLQRLRHGKSGITGTHCLTILSQFGRQGQTQGNFELAFVELSLGGNLK